MLLPTLRIWQLWSLFRIFRVLLLGSISPSIQILFLQIPPIQDPLWIPSFPTVDLVSPSSVFWWHPVQTSTSAHSQWYCACPHYVPHWTTHTLTTTIYCFQISITDLHTYGWYLLDIYWIREIKMEIVEHFVVTSYLPWKSRDLPNVCSANTFLIDKSVTCYFCFLSRTTDSQNVIKYQSSFFLHFYMIF